MTELEQSLLNLTSFKAIDSILNGIVLHPLQSVDVLKMLYSKHSIVRYDTGTGKTLLVAAAMKLLWNEDHSRRFLMFGKKDQLIQTPKKLTDATGMSVMSSSADAKSVAENFRSGKFLNYQIVLITYECLNNQYIMQELFKQREHFCGVILDEAHTVNNRGFSLSADMMSGIASHFEYCWALTATPILTDVLQFAKLANVVDCKRYPNAGRLAKDLRNGVVNIGNDPFFFINRTAEELGRNSKYSGHLIWVNAMPHQTEECGGVALMSLCKGDGAVNQAKALVNLVKAMEGKRGLVYVSQHSVRKWIIPFLEDAGIRFDCINGNIVKERPDILRRFNEERSLDLIITSVTTAIDADCDYVIFYEFTTELKQMIGRADRGLDSKSVDVFYVVTKGSSEPQYFKEHIVDRSIMIKNILGVSYTELDSVCNQIEREVMEPC